MPYNYKGQRHGFWKRYYSNDDLAYKGEYVNGNQIGYWFIFDSNRIRQEYFYAQ